MSGEIAHSYDPLSGRDGNSAGLGGGRGKHPGQLQGLKVDGRSDLFSTAVLFYYLLSSAWPWDGKNPGALVASVLTDAPTPLRDRDPSFVPSGGSRGEDFAAALDPWFQKALVKDRDKRFATASRCWQNAPTWPWCRPAGTTIRVRWDGRSGWARWRRRAASTSAPCAHPYSGTGTVLPTWRSRSRRSIREGFVRLSARRGFHLLLVEEKDGGFHPRFVT